MELANLTLDGAIEVPDPNRAQVPEKENFVDTNVVGLVAINTQNHQCGAKSTPSSFKRSSEPEFRSIWSSSDVTFRLDGQQELVFDDKEMGDVVRHVRLMINDRLIDTKESVYDYFETVYLLQGDTIIDEVHVDFARFYNGVNQIKDPRIAGVKREDMRTDFSTFLPFEFSISKHGLPLYKLMKSKNTKLKVVLKPDVELDFGVRISIRMECILLDNDKRKVDEEERKLEFPVVLSRRLLTGSIAQNEWNEKVDETEAALAAGHAVLGCKGRKSYTAGELFIKHVTRALIFDLKYLEPEADELVLWMFGKVKSRYDRYQLQYENYYKAGLEPVEGMGLITFGNRVWGDVFQNGGELNFTRIDNTTLHGLRGESKVIQVYVNEMMFHEERGIMVKYVYGINGLSGY